MNCMVLGSQGKCGIVVKSVYIISTCFSLEKNHVKSASESVVHLRYLLTLLTYVSIEGKLEDLDEQQSELGLHCLWERLRKHFSRQPNRQHFCDRCFTG